MLVVEGMGRSGAALLHVFGGALAATLVACGALTGLDSLEKADCVEACVTAAEGDAYADAAPGSDARDERPAADSTSPDVSGDGADDGVSLPQVDGQAPDVTVDAADATDPASAKDAAPDTAGGPDGSPGNPIIVVGQEEDVYGVAVSPTHVFWSKCSFGNGAIRRADLDGSNVTTVAESLTYPHYLAANATHVYWGTGTSQIGRVPIAGGPSEVVLSAMGNAVPIALDGTNVYWGNYNEETLYTGPLGGGMPTLFASNQSYPAGIAIHGGYVYYTASAYAQDHMGVVARIPVGGGTPQPLVTGRQEPTALAVDDTNVYWIETGSLMSLPLANPGGPPMLIASVSEPSWVLEDSGFLYLAGWSKIVKIAIVGGASTVLWNVDTGIPGQMTTDAAWLYFTVNGAGGNGRIMKVRK
jgi:hypothetical protein